MSRNYRYPVNSTMGHPSRSALADPRRRFRTRRSVLGSSQERDNWEMCHYEYDITFILPDQLQMDDDSGHRSMAIFTPEDEVIYIACPCPRRFFLPFRYEDPKENGEYGFVLGCILCGELEAL